MHSNNTKTPEQEWEDLKFKLRQQENYSNQTIQDFRTQNSQQKTQSSQKHNTENKLPNIKDIKAGHFDIFNKSSQPPSNRFSFSKHVKLIKYDEDGTILDNQKEQEKSQRRDGIKLLFKIRPDLFEKKDHDERRILKRNLYPVYAAAVLSFGGTSYFHYLLVTKNQFQKTHPALFIPIIFGIYGPVILTYFMYRKKDVAFYEKMSLKYAEKIPSSALQKKNKS